MQGFGIEIVGQVPVPGVLPNDVNSLGTSNVPEPENSRR
jgi:hypothetical protein